MFSSKSLIVHRHLLFVAGIMVFHLDYYTKGLNFFLNAYLSLKVN